MINSNHGSDTPILEKAYGDTLLFYIKKGSEMFSRFPMKLAHDGYVTRAMGVAKQAAEDLRPTLLEWMKAVENNPKIRKRLRHKGLPSQPSDDESQWWERLGLDRTYLPLKISDSDWISMKIASTHKKKCCGIGHCDFCSVTIGGSSSWISCWKSISEEDYCQLRTCPHIAGGQSANECTGERFQIQTTHNGPIKFNDRIAFKYWDWDCSKGRGRGTYWLSTTHGTASDKLYTQTCVGSVFTESDIRRCKNEVFTIERGHVSQEKYLRNGDYVHIKGIRDSGFMMKQYSQTGDKSYC